MKQSPVEAGFRRTIINGNMQIRSTCNACDTTIVGSVREGLPEEEAAHSLACKPKAGEDGCGDD
jgi:hypothetical protein